MDAHGPSRTSRGDATNHDRASAAGGNTLPRRTCTSYYLYTQTFAVVCAIVKPFCHCATPMNEQVQVIKLNSVNRKRFQEVQQPVISMTMGQAVILPNGPSALHTSIMPGTNASSNAQNQHKTAQSSTLMHSRWHE